MADGTHVPDDAQRCTARRHDAFALTHAILEYHRRSTRRRCVATTPCRMPSPSDVEIMRELIDVLARRVGVPTR